jgi:ABC-type sugar transport system ATPase subunit/ribose/xylose/arabinose/galactoside ABC-type transport system permease subunit
MADGQPQFSLQARSVSKRFGGTPVLDQVNFQIQSGEIHTLMGENGAGKSTLMKILAGVHTADSGEVVLDGKPLSLPSPHAAIRAGIALIHQEPLSFPDLSIAENIFLGRTLPRGAIGQVDWATMNRRATELLAKLGVSLDPRTMMRGLSVADQQMVELAAALSLNARVLLMDEPTAALTPQEVEELFRIVRGLKDKGVAIVFVSHRLQEVFTVSDRITVLRDGQCIGSKLVQDTTTDEIVRMMVGRELNSLYERTSATIGPTLLKVSGLTRKGEFTDVSFEARSGEIVGIAGLVGAGRTEVAEAIFGVRPLDAGSITIAGKTVRIHSPRDAVKNAIAYVPEDRQHNGLLLPMTIASNTTLADLAQVSTAGVLRTSRERQISQAWTEKLSTRLRDVSQPAKELSGGNQQKVVLAKWLLTDPQVLIVDEPTRGIDIGAKAEVHHLLADLARRGKAIVMISSDLPEVLAMSDRILVMREGRIAAEFSREEATQEKVMVAATLGGTGVPHVHSSPQRHEGKVLLRSRVTPGPVVPRFFGILAFVLLVFIIASIKEPRFRSIENLRAISMYIPLIVIVAMGQLMVIVSRNIDLSVGSILGLSAIVAGGIFVGHPDFPVSLAALIAVGVGSLLGAVNGLLVAYLRVPAIIATLGTFTAYRGLIYTWSGGRQIDPDKLPQSLIELSLRGPANVPWILFITAIVAILTALFLRFTGTGREMYAIGSNPNAAVLRGIPVKRVLVLIFAITGALCGLAGILWGSRFPTINPASVGVQMELIVISAVVIGGAAVNGGAGTVLGTVLGCLLLGMVNVGLSMLKISEFWQTTLYGAAIIIAAALDATLRRRRAGGTA